MLAALPKIADWTAAAGLEKFPASAPVLMRLIGTFTDDFGDSSLNPKWTPRTAGNGSVVETSLLTFASPANADAAFIYYNRNLNRGMAETYKVKFKLNADVTTNRIFILQQQAGAPAPDTVNNLIANRVLVVYTVPTNSLRFGYYDSGGALYTWNGSQWAAGSYNAYTFAVGTVYTFVLETDGFGWKMILKNADESSTLAQTTGVPWASVRNNGNSNWVVAGGEMANDNYTSNMALTQAVFPQDYATTSPVAESPWTAIDQNTLGNIVLFENPLVGTGSLKYQYALNSGAYNGSWLTLSQLQAALSGATITNKTNSLRLKAQFNSNGTQQVELVIASYLEASGITAGGGGISRARLVNAGGI